MEVFEKFTVMFNYVLLLPSYVLDFRTYLYSWKVLGYERDSYGLASIVYYFVSFGP
jgi:hypothetical protein